MDSVNFLSEIVGAFADPIAENPTIVMMEAAFRHHHLDWRYVNFRVTKEGLSDAVRGARAMNWAGFNCSLPHKVTILSLLDEVSSAAKAIGAVNCVIIRDGRLIGENTDGIGFVQSLQRHIEVRDSSMLLLGAGGVARAITVESVRAGLKSLAICARNRGQAEEVIRLAREAGIQSASYLPWRDTIEAPRAAEVVVNATSVGLYPRVTDRPPLILDSLDAETVVADVIANPPVTALLQEAVARGLQIISGREMLVNQAARSIKLWTSIDVDTSIMHRELDKALES